MKDCVRFCKQMICVAECVLLSAILADDTLLAAVLAGITVLVMLPSIVYIVYTYEQYHFIHKKKNYQIDNS